MFVKVCSPAGSKVFRANVLVRAGLQLGVQQRQGARWRSAASHQRDCNNLSGRAGGEANVTDQHERLLAKGFLGDGGVAPTPWELPAAA